MYRKFRGIRLGSAALLAAGMLLAGAPGAADAATVYTAGDDDTFWKLSRKFGVPLDKLMERRVPDSDMMTTETPTSTQSSEPESVTIEGRSRGER